MAQTSSDGLLGSSEEYLSLQDVLHAFNNSINEEQAWAVCYQCAQYFLSNSTQDKFREIYYYGTVAIRFGKDGEIVIDATTLIQGSGKGPPRKRSSFSLSREFKANVQQIDAVQALGSAIYKALDFGLSATEEPHLAPDLEEVIDFMTNPEEDDEGIDQCIFQDIIDMCVKHVSDQDNAGQHYKAVCRALVTEAKQLTTFLDNITRGHERLARNSNEEADGLDDLQRSDWARLWVQIMRELRQGVRLRKVEHVQLTPLEFELTPFEILLEDIKLGRYKLNRIMVNGDIPPKVKNDAHAVILDFIRSRPPLKSVKRRELSAPPRKEMDARELLMHEIRQPHKLKHVKQGKVVVGARSLPLKLDDISSDEDSPKPVRKIIKPVADFQVSDEDTEDSSVLSEGTDDEGHHRISAPVMSPLSPVYPTADPDSWKRTVAKDMVTQNSNCRALSRRHTITVCDTGSRGRKVQQTPLTDLVIGENEENAGDNFVRGHASRRPTKLISYRQHGNKMHGNGGVSSDLHCVHETNVSRADSPKMHANVLSRRRSEVFISNNNHVHEPVSDTRNRVCVSNSVVNPPRSMSPCRHVPRSVSPCQHAGRAESPVRFLSRSETFTTSIPQNSRNCVRKEPYVTARCDSPQTRQMARSESFTAPRCVSPSHHVRSESPCRHSVSSVHSVRNSACEKSSVHDRCSSPCRKVAQSERPVSPCARTCGNRSRSQSPCRRLSQTDNVHVSNNLHSSNKAVPVLRHSRSVQRKPSKSVSDINDKKDEVSISKQGQYVSVKNHSQRLNNQISHKNKIETVANRTVPLSLEADHLSLQESHSEHLQKEQEVTTVPDKKSLKPRPGIIRARSKPELIPSDLKIKSDSFDSEPKRSVRERPVSELDFRRPYSSRLPRALSVRSQSEKQLVPASHSDSNDLETMTRVSSKADMEFDRTGTKAVSNKVNADQTVENRRPNTKMSESVTQSRTSTKVDPKEESHWGLIESKPKKEVKLSRQSAIRAERKDVRLVHSEKNQNIGKDEIVQSDLRSRKSEVVSFATNQDKSLEMRTEEKKIDQTNNKPDRALRPRVKVAFNETKQSVNVGDDASANVRPVRTIIRSKSEVRPRAEVKDVQRALPETDVNLRGQLRSVVSRSENRPVRGLHYLDRTDLIEKQTGTLESEKERRSPVPSSGGDEKLLNGDEGDSAEESSSAFSGLSSAIKGLSQLNVTDLLHVSWKSECPRKETNDLSPCSDCRPVSNKWQNPIECLSLTLEEVTHIRMVLTKAELESLITDPELYKLVSKGKVCFTCKNTKFSIFGQWSTKCKLCQRNVCNYCLRKMNVPTEHFEKIPVYTLSPVPISPEVLEAIKVYESTGSVPHSPTSERKKEESREERSLEIKDDSQTVEEKLAAKRRTLQRSHTIGVGSRPLPNKALLKGPQMSICCDCKTMIMEIIRASRTSASLVKDKSDPIPSTEKPSQATPNRNSLGVPMRARVQNDRPRPRSMLENLNFRSFSISRSTTDA